MIDFPINPVLLKMDVNKIQEGCEITTWDGEEGTTGIVLMVSPDGVLLRVVDRKHVAKIIKVAEVTCVTKTRNDVARIVEIETGKKIRWNDE